ncbi:MAG: ATP-binding cassette domain-containing protein [Ferruginibacter sp.]
MNIVSVNGLSKNYGKIQALKEVSFSVPEGTVFGILGPNGSGKTTLLGILMNVLRPTKGSFTLFDTSPGPEQRQQIGTLLETPNFYHYLTASQNLRIVAQIKNQPEADIDRVLHVVDLFNRRHSLFNTYSLGMKQRLAIASCLLGNPSVLVLDEPTNGLDPVGIAEIRTLIRSLSAEGKTIIMASHLLDEVEKVCTHVAILRSGVLMRSGNVDEIFQNEDLVQLSATDNELLKRTLENFPGYGSLQVLSNMVEISFPAGTVSLQGLNRYCFEKGIVLSHLALKRKSLETQFLELTHK